MGEDVTGEVS